MRVLSTLIVALIAAVATHATDASAQTCESPPSTPLTSVQPLTATFLGTTTIALSDGVTTIMIDGFLSRPSASDVAFGEIAPNRRIISAALDDANIGDLAAVLVAHSHYDHALDSVDVADHHGDALVVGSASTANLARGAGYSNFCVIEPNSPLRIGAFNVRAISSPHSLPTLFPGDIEEPLRLPAHVSRMRYGGNFSFLIEHQKRRILITTSANFTPKTFRGVRADVVFLSIGSMRVRGERFVREYWSTAVANVGAHVVTPIHWDNFTRPLARPLPRGAGFAWSMGQLEELAGDSVDICVLDAFQTLRIGTRLNDAVPVQCAADN
jgi:L-ascorbate metabolism protein UlaG (beta-lactamase superfamily)